MGSHATRSGIERTLVVLFATLCIPVYRLGKLGTCNYPPLVAALMMNLSLHFPSITIAWVCIELIAGREQKAQQI